MPFGSCDFVVSATGVEPTVGFVDDAFSRGQDGGLLVDDTMRVLEVGDHSNTARSSRRNGGGRVYAAGDACCCDGWEDSSKSPHWFQMRLWSQARSMGTLAARAMVAHQRRCCVDDDVVGEDDYGEEEDDALALGGGVAFELFTHVTHFLGRKVVLLGCFNAQGDASIAARAAVARVVVTSFGLVDNPDMAAQLAQGTVGAEQNPSKFPASSQLVQGTTVGAAEQVAKAPDAATTMDSSRVESRAAADGSEILIRVTPHHE